MIERLWVDCALIIRARCIAMLVSTAAAAAAPRAVLLHDEAPPMETLGSALRRHGFEAALQEHKAFAPLRGKADVVFMYVHGVIDEAVEAALIGYADSGGRLIVLHHGMASARMRNARWPAFMGIRILSRDAPGNAWIACEETSMSSTSRRGTGSPRMALPGDSRLRTFLPMRPQPSSSCPRFDWLTRSSSTTSSSPMQEMKTVLLGVKITTGGRTVMQDRGGWMMPAGRGQVFYFQPGHFARDFEHPAFVQILVNAARWKPGM